MKTIPLILGNITFDNFSEREKQLFNTDAKRKALIHSVDGVIMCENRTQAEAIGEMLVNEYGAYLVPDAFNGEVVYQTPLIESLVTEVTENFSK